MRKIESVEKFLDVININEIIIVIFTSKSCSVCGSIVAKLESLENSFEVYINEVPTLQSQAEVFSAPTVIVYYGAKQLRRFSGVFSIIEILEYINRMEEYVYT